MSNTITVGWTETEIKISRQVLNKAYEKEIKTLIEQVKKKINTMEDIDQLWQIHDLLSSKRYDLDGKYDDRESTLVFTFAQLIKEGWVSLEDLAGLDPKKLAQISSLARM